MKKLSRILRSLKDMKSPFKIFFAAQDPGGFNVILPVIKELKKRKGFILKVFLANQSRDMAKKNRISYQNSNYLTVRKLIQIFKKERPDLIFIATSHRLSIEKKITKIAKAQGIKTCAVIDFWTNYKLRFSDPKSENLVYLPDYILVIDEIMKREMVEVGFDPKRLIVTGNPFFDTFSSLSGPGQKEEIISFFCQPISEFYNRDYLGYDEIRVFEDLVEVLGKLKVKLPVKIKFHPVTKNLKKFDKIIKNSRLRQGSSGQAGLKISIEKKLPVEDLIKKSKLVIGMYTMVLFQAAMMDKKVLSYQPNLKGTDTLISNRLKMSTAVYKKKNLYPALKKMLLSKSKNKNLKLIKKYTQNQSTQKVIDFIKHITNK